MRAEEILTIFLLTITAGWQDQRVDGFSFHDGDETGVAVRLYLDTQFRGLQKDLTATSQCTNLEGTWNNAAISVAVNGGCVKFYDGNNCDGKTKTESLTRQTSYGAANLQLIGLNKKISSFVKC